MEEIMKMIINYGTSAVIVVLFLYDWYKNKNKIAETLEQNKKCLENMEKSNSNIATTLDLLKDSMDTQKAFLQKHDKRCEAIENEIEDINKKIIGG